MAPADVASLSPSPGAPPTPRLRLGTASMSPALADEGEPLGASGDSVPPGAGAAVGSGKAEVCPHCGLSFSRKDALKRHLKVKDGEALCCGLTKRGKARFRTMMSGGTSSRRASASGGGRRKGGGAKRRRSSVDPEDEEMGDEEGDVRGFAGMLGDDRLGSVGIEVEIGKQLLTVAGLLDTAFGRLLRYESVQEWPEDLRRYWLTREAGRRRKETENSGEGGGWEEGKGKDDGKNSNSIMEKGVPATTTGDSILVPVPATTNPMDLLSRFLAMAASNNPPPIPQPFAMLGAPRSFSRDVLAGMDDVGALPPHTQPYVSPYLAAGMSEFCEPHLQHESHHQHHHNIPFATRRVTSTTAQAFAMPTTTRTEASNNNTPTSSSDRSPPFQSASVSTAPTMWGHNDDGGNYATNAGRMLDPRRNAFAYAAATLAAMATMGGRGGGGGSSISSGSSSNDDAISANGYYGSGGMHAALLGSAAYEPYIGSYDHPFN
ncbi:hypothetical protein BJ742DRAFT_143148 [Cladochytrium replicatum]|nr:hypothetical protein BJ742DRAFT_143148 [Cladochytrium replicatum]